MARFLQVGYFRFINLDDIEEISSPRGERWYAKLRGGRRVFIKKSHDVPIEVVLATSDIVPAGPDEKLFTFEVNDKDHIVVSTVRIVAWAVSSSFRFPITTDGCSDTGVLDDGKRAVFIRNPNGKFDDLGGGIYENEAMIMAEMRCVMKLAKGWDNDKDGEEP